ncbi:uncharacterized protein [Haliotis cracherodii]|uniref:uncharacterized protein n=1 Tax=Haliotis cracherodii TaxID=6455 RepID=UPI0039EC2C3C
MFDEAMPDTVGVGDDIQSDAASSGSGDGGSSGTQNGTTREASNHMGCCGDIEKACENCLSAICCGTCIGYAFCCLPMKKKNRVRCIWAWLCVLSVTGGILMSVGIYGTGHSSPSPTDMRIVTHKISSIFCKKLLINSTSHLTTYSFNEEPQIDSNSSQTFSTELKTTFRNDYIFWTFYLLKGSRVELRSCSEADIWIYVIAGTSNWKLWSQNLLCSDCYLQKHLLKRSRCSNNSMSDVFTFMVHKTDDYFVLYSRTSFAAFLHVKLSLDRTLYDLTKATRVCTNGLLACEYVLQFPLKPYIVYHMGAVTYGRNTGLVTVCEPRVWVYFGIFFILPFSFGAVLSVVVAKFCKEPSRARSTRRPRAGVIPPTSDDERDYLFSPSQDVCHYSGIPQPPKYEDIERLRDSPPPSYEATMRQSGPV